MRNYVYRRTVAAGTVREATRDPSDRGNANARKVMDFSIG